MAVPNFQNNAGANTNVAVTGEYITHLHFAVTSRDLSLISSILEKGTYQFINAQTCYGQTALHLAMRYPPFYQPDYSIVHRLLQCKNINVNILDLNSLSPLLLAVHVNCLEVIELLLFNGADPNLGSAGGNSCLHVALTRYCPNYYIVRQLLWKGANIYAKNMFGHTPVDILIRQIKNYETFRFAMRCCKVMVLRCNVHRLLISKLEHIPQLFHFVSKCYEEIERMKDDTISGNFTLYRFLTDPSEEERCFASILQTHKPVVEKLVHGFYIEYFYDIFDRIENRSLHVIAETVICCGICMNRINEDYPKLVAKRDLGILKLLSRLDIFYLIVAFSNVRISKEITDLRRRGFGFL